MINRIQFFIILIFALLLMCIIVNEIILERSIESEQTTQSIAEDVSVDITNILADVKEENESSSDEETTGKVVYLTFDDGPSSATNKILDTLAKYNAKATFFMLEPAMKKYPNEVKKTVNEGHGVGLHGVTHELEKFYDSEQSAIDEMKKAQITLEKITGVYSSLVRTPFGTIPYFTDSFREVFDENGLRVWDWNVDSSDWNLSKDEYVNNVISQVEKLDSDGITPIILMHDRGETASHLSTLLSYLQKHGFQTKVLKDDMEAYHFKCYDRCQRLRAK